MTINKAAVGRPPAPVTWPDTTGQDQPPRDNLYASAIWLLGRNPVLARLVQRIPGAVTIDDEGAALDLELLADVFTELDDYHHRWQVYERAHPAPDAEDRPQQYDDWCAAGPRHSRATGGLLPMSRSEITMLRMLAAFAPTRLPLSVSDLWGIDSHYVQDWCRAVYLA